MHLSRRCTPLERGRRIRRDPPLPVLSDAAGFGRLPQMVLAFGGEEAILEVEQGHVLTSARLDALDLANGSTLSYTGLLPYAYGNDSATALTNAGTYTSIEGFEQRDALDGVVPVSYTHLRAHETQ